MPIFDINGRRLLFIHVPKAGGTSVTDFLGRHGTKTFDAKGPIYGKIFRPRHLHAEVLERIFVQGMFDHVFMVVRNPVDKLVSEYRYQRRKKNLHWQYLTTFETWLRYSLWRSKIDKSYRENHFRRQMEFSCFGCKTFRVEDGFEELVSWLSKITGLQGIGDIGKLNKSPSRNIYVNEKCLNLIHHRYSEDYIKFGYSFDYT